MIVVTGGAGFIGSNIVAALNEAGRMDVAVCDRLGRDGKWQNLRQCVVQDIVPPHELLAWLDRQGEVEAIIHMGANSSTMAQDGDEVMESNFRFSLALLDWCTKRQVRFIYASSAATYGDGAHGFEDDLSLAYLRRLRPLNLYGWSKQLFDQVVASRRESGQALPPLCIGLKFFNVFGMNEGHKGAMMSLASKYIGRIRNGETIDLFRSYNPAYRDGEQLRDFVYVADITAVILWLLEQSQGVALYNCGSGQARSFLDLVGAIFDTLGLEHRIRFVEMPEVLRQRYQYFTQADNTRLRAAGYDRPGMKLEDAIHDFVRLYQAAHP
ncbi:ADP-glyceromanno-heptose 6-epimerase [Novacetimonas maltaceti]|uniref:ADP-L-glycero-D-manno-heptose-6-epimerase n=1 Tax=Novacetimonas maltaceti TaxID=1203393 RepID=A0A2S3W1G8_9PROT|nr:ADP-glyceromanno-heptose 6-epimerase [Novacetimonas maltaceti]POF62711.1 ADP-L-glycero-D-manno-heptose-6-epimerase [Novacetimonas maltaceti]PYD60149.1 ADP-glyceromanno-heptose 6-epimerase [Novacetimonas maltaceti]